MTEFDPAQSLANLKLERDAIALYDALAAIEKDDRGPEAFRTIAGNERRHAEIWADKLRELGVDVPAPSGRPDSGALHHRARPAARDPAAVSDLVQALEGDEEVDLPGAGVARGRRDRRRRARARRRSGGS